MPTSSDTTTRTSRESGNSGAIGRTDASLCTLDDSATWPPGHFAFPPAAKPHSRPIPSNSKCEVDQDLLARLPRLPPIHDFSRIKPAEGLDLFISRQEHLPSGSIKAKAANAMLQDAIQTGRLTRYGIVVESTSGNLGIALAMFCSELGITFIAVVDPNAASEALATMKAYGAEIVMVDQRDAAGGFLATRIAKVKEILHQNPNAYWPNQYANPMNPGVHERTTFLEIAESFEHIDRIYLGVGTGGTATGTARAFARHRADVARIAIDAVGSISFGEPPGPRHIPGLGASRVPENLDPTVFNDVGFAREADAIVVCRWLARQCGLLLGGSTGSVIAGAVQHHRRTGGQPATCVAISPDGGAKYLSTIHNDDWVTERYGRDPIIRGAAQDLEI